MKGQRALTRYERFLRINADSRIGDKVHARLVYGVAWVFIALQIVNFVNMFFTYGRFHFQHVVSLLACAGLIGVTLALRYTRSRFFYGAVYSGLILSAVGLASVHAANPFLGGGINTSLLPILAVAPILIGVVSTWRAAVIYTLLAAGLMVGLKLYSATILDFAEPELLSVIPTNQSLSVGESLILNHNQRLVQSLIALIVTALVGIPTAHRLYNLFDTLEGHVNEAKASESAKGEFLAHMSHEIRTPLNGVIAMSEMLLMQELPERARQQAEIVHNAGGNLMEIVNDVLDLARLDAGRLEIVQDEFDLRAACERVVTLHKPNADAQGLWLGLEWQAELPSRVIGDAPRIRQIIGNFVSNALKFTDHGGVRIGVRGAQTDRGSVAFQIYVQDTGAGIEPDAQGIIFERYEQSNSGRNQGRKGTGLGLSIVRELAELMGGSVGVNSVPGQGSVFYAQLELPLAAAAPVTMANPYADPAGTAAA